MQISVFGYLSVHDRGRELGPGDFGGRKPKQLLELLLLARGRAVNKEVLSEALWPTNEPKNVAATLDTYVCVLRQHLFTDRLTARRFLVTMPSAYRLVCDHLELDLDRFDALTRRAEGADRRSERLQLLEEALSIADGDVLEDEPYAPWAEPDRVLYRDRIGRARLGAARDALVEGEPSSALRHAEAALRAAPFSEGAFRIVMLASYVLGHEDLAYATFARCRDVMGRQLGVDPTTETAQLAAAIDAGAPASDLVALVASRSEILPGSQRAGRAIEIPA
jgi:DNA-binding SARP family transcriptional activator